MIVIVLLLMGLVFSFVLDLFDGPIRTKEDYIQIFGMAFYLFWTIVLFYLLLF